MISRMTQAGWKVLSRIDIDDVSCAVKLSGNDMQRVINGSEDRRDEVEARVDAPPTHKYHCAESICLYPASKAVFTVFSATSGADR